MKKFILSMFLIPIFACESEKIPYHCSIPSEQDALTIGDTGFDATDVSSLDGTYFISTKLTDIYEPGDTSSGDIDYRDAGVQDVRGSDAISGRVCTKIGVSSECGIEESCYPFLECGGICRKCGSLPAGSNCEIHSDCKCQMVCLSLADRQLRCYKVCDSNFDCPSGQTCSDGWNGLYEHEYYKICVGATVSNTNNNKGEGK